jgi:hypothetical protein
MTDVKARYVGPNPDGVTLGVVLADGDIHPLTIPHGGELPQEIDGRKVSKSYRDGLLAQEDNWTSVRRDAKTSKDGEK